MHINCKVIRHNATSHVLAVLKLERLQGREIGGPQLVENTCPPVIARISGPVYPGVWEAGNIVTHVPFINSTDSSSTFFKVSV